MDNLAAAPASLRKAPRATFCFAWHTDAPADKLLEWLQVNVQWAARALQWSDSYQLHSSAPENDADMPLPTASVVLASATLLAESEEYSAAESSISEVLSEEFKSPVECYVTCPGPLPLFQGSLTTLTASGTEHATQLLRQHGVVVLPGCMDRETVGHWQRQVDDQVALLEGLLEARGVPRQDNVIFTFREIAARGRHRFDARLDAGPLWQRPEAAALRAALRSAPWTPAVHSMLGENPVAITSVVYSRPGADAQVVYHVKEYQEQRNYSADSLLQGKHLGKS